VTEPSEAHFYCGGNVSIYLSKKEEKNNIRVP
jgi:hypothetical protein